MCFILFHLFTAHSFCQHQTLLTRGANEKAKLTVHGPKLLKKKRGKRILQFGFNCLFTCSDFFFLSPIYSQVKSINSYFHYFCIKQTAVYPHNLAPTTFSPRLDQVRKWRFIWRRWMSLGFIKTPLKTKGEMLNSSSTSQTLFPSVWLTSLHSPLLWKMYETLLQGTWGQTFFSVCLNKPILEKQNT